MGTTNYHTELPIGFPVAHDELNPRFADLDEAIGLNNWEGVADPTVDNDSSDGYSTRSWWFNTSTKTLFKCMDATVGAAVWEMVYPSSAHYRAGVVPIYIADDQLRVSAGVVDIDDSAQESTDSAILDTDTAADYVSGTSEKGANKWLYVYVRRDTDGGWTPKLSAAPPLFSDTQESFVFEARVNGEPAAGATSISYDGDTGESSVEAGDVLRCWTDADYTVVRCAWTVTAVNTSTNAITVRANNNDAADDDYLTIAYGMPRYRKFSGTWWRCIGTIRLDGSQDILRFYTPDRNTVFYDRLLSQSILSGGSSTSWVSVSAANYIPPISCYAKLFLHVVDSTTQSNLFIRPTGGVGPTNQIYTQVRLQMEGNCPVDSSQSFDYHVAYSTNTAKIWVMGYQLNL